MLLSDIGPEVRRRAENHYETVARSLFQLRGFAAPSPDQLGQIVHGAVAGASVEELRSADGLSAAAVGRIDQLVANAVEAGRPRNRFSAEAARLEQMGAHGAASLLGHKGYAELQRGRLEAAREARDGSERGDRSGSRSGDRYGELPAAGDRVSSAVMGAYVQQYAGTGLGRGTVQNFAEIGLQRGVYDAYRKEGFSREDIGDAAKTTKTLGWKNDRQAFDDVQRSTRPERAAFVAIDREKDEEKRKALIEHKRRELHIDEKPQGHRERYDRAIDRIQAKGHAAVHKHGRVAAADESSAALKAERAQDHGKPAVAKVRVANLEASKAHSGAAEASAREDDFKMPSKPTPPTKVAEAEPATPGPKVG